MDQESPLKDFSHPGWTFLFKDICQTYLPFLRENALTWRAGGDRFDFETQGVRYPNLPVVHYRVWCREELQQHYEGLTEGVKEEVRKRLDPGGGMDALFADGRVDSGLSEEFVLPLEGKERPLGIVDKLKLRLTGTPWDMPKPGVRS
jgi:hypothetical protein